MRPTRRRSCRYGFTCKVVLPPPRSAFAGEGRSRVGCDPAVEFGETSAAKFRIVRNYRFGPDFLAPGVGRNVGLRKPAQIRNGSQIARTFHDVRCEFRLAVGLDRAVEGVEVA